MADRMGLDGTMLHYLAVWKATMSVHKPVHSKITLTYLLTWQTDCCTPRRMAFKALLNASFSLGFALVFSLRLLFEKTLPEWAPTKTQLRVLSIMDQLLVWARRRSTCALLSPLYPSLYPYVTHVINYPRPSPAFPYCKRQKAGRSLGTRLVIYTKNTVFVKG